MILDLNPILGILDMLRIPHERTNTWHVKCKTEGFAINSYFNQYQLDVYCSNVHKLIFTTESIYEMEENLKMLMMLKR